MLFKKHIILRKAIPMNKFKMKLGNVVKDFDPIENGWYDIFFRKIILEIVSVITKIVEIKHIYLSKIGSNCFLHS